jgi:2-polyprenyl-3-methyl-5-hydroxy-6-metoxy-1,4-benzoquinol methylase
MLAEAGFVVCACELDPAKAGRASSFAEVDLCDVREWSPPSPLDLALCAELIEHLPPDDQVALLRKIRTWLRPGGHLVLSTPQRNSSVALVERAYTRLRRRARYDWWDPTHTSVLSRTSLERLFRDEGFSVHRRIGLHVVPELVPIPSFHWTRHEGPVSRLAFDLVYVLT